MRETIAAACLAVLPFGTAIAETIGTVTAAFDGGEARTFYANVVDGQSRSSWLSIMPGALTGASFSIWANPAAEANAMSDVLVLGASLVRAPNGYRAIAEAQYLESGFDRFWTAAEENAVQIELSGIEVDGDTLVVEGSFTAPLTYAEGASAPVLDPERQTVITGTFSARLPKD
ncbi:MAG: hypothetical protein AAGG09_02340 [Pseudomonadota bacterium]